MPFILYSKKAFVQVKMIVCIDLFLTVGNDFGSLRLLVSRYCLLWLFSYSTFDKNCKLAQQWAQWCYSSLPLPLPLLSWFIRAQFQDLLFLGRCHFSCAGCSKNKKKFVEIFVDIRGAVPVLLHYELSSSLRRTLPGVQQWEVNQLIDFQFHRKGRGGVGIDGIGFMGDFNSNQNSAHFQILFPGYNQTLEMELGQSNSTKWGQVHFQIWLPNEA